MRGVTSDQLPVTSSDPVLADNWQLATGNGEPPMEAR